MRWKVAFWNVYLYKYNDWNPDTMSYFKKSVLGLKAYMLSRCDKYLSRRDNDVSRRDEYLSRRDKDFPRRD